MEAPSPGGQRGRLGNARASLAIAGGASLALALVWLGLSRLTAVYWERHYESIAAMEGDESIEAAWLRNAFPMFLSNGATDIHAAANIDNGEAWFRFSFNGQIERSVLQPTCERSQLFEGEHNLSPPGFYSRAPGRGMTSETATSYVCAEIARPYAMRCNYYRVVSAGDDVHAWLVDRDRAARAKSSLPGLGGDACTR